MAILKINEQKKLSHIAPEIYGHFSEHLGRCIYEGIYVGDNSKIPNENGMRTDVVEALKELKVPMLRWPGGCFADEYHWKDGTGPKETPKKMINTHWGGTVEDNSFGTHEFFELVRQLGCKAYVNGNVGSGTVQEMSEWVEYITFKGVSPMADLRARNGHPEPWKVDFWGVGNENWGCGGANVDDYEWTETVLDTTFGRCPEELHGQMDALVAAITLNIFNKHSDRVRMACLAQMVNVLQAVILTESVSMDKDGIITVTLGNLSAEKSETLEIQLAEEGYHVVEAKIVASGDIHDHNTIDAPNVVEEKDWTVKDMTVELPAASVVMIRLSK